MIVADVDRERAAAVATAVGATVVDPAGLVLADLDVLSPCALGGAIEPRHVGRLRARVIAGAANNQLSDPAISAALATAGVLYVPDFIANSGGIIDVGAEVLGLGDAEVEQRLVGAELRIHDVLVGAADSGRTPWELAVELAGERVAEAERRAVAPAYAGASR